MFKAFLVVFVLVLLWVVIIIISGKEFSHFPCSGCGRCRESQDGNTHFR